MYIHSYTSHVYEYRSKIIMKVYFENSGNNTCVSTAFAGNTVQRSRYYKHSKEVLNDFNIDFY